MTRRTYLRLGGAELSGCNLFYLADARALRVLRFWQAAEQDRKRPWRIAWRLGPLTALRIILAAGPGWLRSLRFCRGGSGRRSRR